MSEMIDIDIPWATRDEACQRAKMNMLSAVTILTGAGYISEEDSDTIHEMLLNDKKLPPQLSFWQEDYQ